MGKAGFLHVAAAVRRGSEGPSEGIRRIRRGFPEEEPSATAERIIRAFHMVEPWLSGGWKDG